MITTARTQIGDKVVGYGSGADLYLTKPVHPQELMAGVNALGKRLRSLGEHNHAAVLDLTQMQLTGTKGKAELTASDPPSAATLQMRITRLRKKLASVGAPAPHIKALHNVGYTLCTPVVLQ